MHAVYPINIKNLSELLEPPIPDWMAVVGHDGIGRKMFETHFLYEMKESLKPHIYWVWPDCNQEYSPNPEFKLPKQLEYLMCIVHEREVY